MEFPNINNNNNNIDKDKISSILELFPNLSIKQATDCLKSNDCNIETTINYLVENIDSLESINKIVNNNNSDGEEKETTIDDINSFKTPEEIENERLFKEFMKNEGIQSEKANEKKTHSCLVCYNDLPITDFYILDECNHKYCNDCLEAHYSMQVRSGHSDLKCPYPKCRYNPTYQEVKHILSNELFEKYDKLLFNSHLGKDRNIRYCPVPDCGSPIILPSNINSDQLLDIVCPNQECLSSYCSGCREESHSSLTCAEWADVKEEIAAHTNQVVEEGLYIEEMFNSVSHDFRNQRLSKKQKKRLFLKSRYWANGKIPFGINPKTYKWITENTKQCPRCKSIIEKSSGCNSMVCVCSENFCYGCGIPSRSHPYYFPCL